MCGIIFSHSRKKLTNEELDLANQSIGRRGPDYFGVSQHHALSGHWVTMAHSLLDISGAAVKQPYISQEFPEKYLLFNGEVYNFNEFSNQNSDTTSILPGASLAGADFFQKIRGEFAILIYDRGLNKLDLYTDPFMTKPIFIGRSSIPSELGVASYPSALQILGFNQIHMAEPNTHYSFDFSGDGISLSQRSPLHHFNISQTQTSYEKFFECLIESVRLRATHGAHVPALSLSSGYDSGAICLALNLIGAKYRTISVNSGENEMIMRERLVINDARNISHTSIAPLGKHEIQKVKEKIRGEVEAFTYAHSDGNVSKNDLSSDSGAIGAYVVAQKLKSLGVYVNLSGSGADEIYSDYGFGGEKYYSHSEFGGLFPDDLNGFFPWKKFYGDTQRSYLFKEEILFGHFGIESRYPLLDRELVQEFLLLSPELKNAQYKAPLAAFLQKYNYPYEPNRKRGFSARDMPIGRKIKKKLGEFFS